jgi:hypothetical protein
MNNKADESTVCITRGPERFSTSKLQISDLFANIRIDVWDLPVMAVTVSGPKEAAEAIVIRAQERTLLIRGGSRRGSSDEIHIRSKGSVHTISIQGSSIGSMSISGGNVTVRGGVHVSSVDVAEISVNVPRGSDIALQDTDGETRIGDVCGSLNVHVKGGGEIRSGHMVAAGIEILGDTRVELTEVNGPLAAQIMGSGNVHVRGGVITSLQVQIMGSGDFRFDGEAHTAVLSTMGSGDIRVMKVATTPMKQCMGSGKIRVG